MFKSISENVSAEIVEKKSRFIANLFYIETEKEAEELIKQMNKKYFDARHNCYAYCVTEKNGIVSRFSDDGEPSGTAGSPMLNILTSQNLSNVLIVVTRYFGGILLGTGGLVKAYSSALDEALKQTQIVEMELGKEVKFKLKYPDLEKLKYYFNQKNIKITNIEYEENVSILVEITQDKLEEILENKLSLNFKIDEYEVISEKFVII